MTDEEKRFAIPLWAKGILGALALTGTFIGGNTQPPIFSEEMRQIGYQSERAERSLERRITVAEKRQDNDDVRFNQWEKRFDRFEDMLERIERAMPHNASRPEKSRSLQSESIKPKENQGG